MDGAQGTLRSSLQFRLSAWISATIVGVAAIAGIASFALAFDEAIELQDGQLRQMAVLASRGSAPPGSPVEPDTDSEERVVVQTLPPTGTAPASGTGSAFAPTFPATLVDGMQTITLERDSWRVFVRPLGSGARVAVGQRTALRDEIARDSALRTVAPFLILVPLLLVLVRALIGRMLAPLKRMATDLDRRGDQDLDPIADANVPTEVRPFVVAIDRLLARVARSVSAQQRFIADAAHELRSPMTALSLQAQQLDAVEMTAVARRRLGALRSGIQRTRELLDQLLALARAQQPPQGGVAAVSLRQALRNVLEDLLPLAEAKGVDIGVEGAGDVSVRAHEVDLKTLIKNLIDNAIRYTPAGGRVDLCLTESNGAGRLQIDDTGPGIAEAERARAFDPFYRVVGSDESGSGLGLSIVKAVADRLQATVELDWADTQRQQGLAVKVTFPTPVPGHPTRSAAHGAEAPQASERERNER